MSGLWIVLEVIGLFFLRIGVPLLMVIVLGIALDRWQSRRAEAYPPAPPEPQRQEQTQGAMNYPPTLKHDRSHP